MVWASLLAPSRHGNPSTLLHRMHALSRVGLPVLVLVQVDPDRQVERVQPDLLQVVAELLDPGLVRDRRVGVRRLAGPSVGSSPCRPCTW